MSAPVTPAPEPAKGGRYQRSPLGMVGAMIVLVALVAVFVLVRGLNRDELPPPVQTFDWQQTLSFARDDGALPVVAPAALPEGWRATSVDYVGGETPRWQLGMLTDQERFVGLEQSTRDAETLVETYVDGEAERGEDQEVGGALGGTWQSWTDDGGDFALVREYDGSTVLVVGTAGEDVVTDFAASLQPAP